MKESHLSLNPYTFCHKSTVVLFVHPVYSQTIPVDGFQKISYETDVVMDADWLKLYFVHAKIM